MEQPQPRSTANRAPTSLSLLLALAATLSGCVEPTQRPVVAIPAARSQGEGRPLRIEPPIYGVAKLDAIVRVVSDVTCTGTLIADDRVLTAHHCVAARDASGAALEHDKAPEEIGIELGGDYLPWGEVTVRAIVAPDCGYRAGHGDIAILVLSRHLIGVPTSPIRIEAPPERKDKVELYGFGRCALTKDAIHRVSRSADLIDAVAPGHFSAPASVCPGDSGGPVYSKKGDLIGVISASVMDGDDSTMGTSIFTRVDIWPQLFSAAHEIANGASPSELPPYGDCRLSTSRARSSQP